jgi:hypothetical protein
VATRSAVPYHSQDIAKGHFEILFLDKVHQVWWPEGMVRKAEDGEEADIATSILLLHYLLAADGTAVKGEWIAFRSLPGGLGYQAAFEARASRRLTQTFGSDQSGFEAAAKTLAGERLSFGDASFLFRTLPRVWLAIVLYLADEEFPASANVLFDAGASHYLPTEDLAVVGGMLAGRLIKETRN